MKNQHRIAAFTMVELLVVIGIILILMAFLFPMVKSVRYSAYAASTQSEIAVLSAAINQYYADFSAYPGPLSDNQLCPSSSNANDIPSIRPTEINNPNQAAGTSIDHINGSENLVLGLLGGLATDTQGDGYSFWFDKTTVGLGPLSLNSLNPHRYSAYLQTSPSWLSPGEFYDEAGRFCYDTAIPKFVDQFPDPLPILYVRARRGAPGVIDSTTNPANPSVVPQYNVDQIWCYALPSDPPGQFPPNGQCVGLPWFSGNPGASQWHGLRRLGAAYSSSVTSYNSDGYNSNGAWDAVAYFTNPNSSTTNPAARCPDQYILISAGKDRTYGSADDLTNFGSPR